MKVPFYWRVLQAAALACWLLLGMIAVAITAINDESSRNLALMFVTTASAIALNIIVINNTKYYKEVNNK